MKIARARKGFLGLAALLAVAAAVSPLFAAEPICGVCGKAITGRYVEVDGQAYHIPCYEQYRAPRCPVCGKPILDARIPWEGKNYHPDCYRQAIQPHCAVCGKPIEGQYVV